VFDGPPPPCIKLPLEYAIVLSWDEKGMGVQVHISVGDNNNIYRTDIGLRCYLSLTEVAHTLQRITWYHRLYIYRLETQ